jgi:predicted O-methyltransferase YrrM
LITHDPTLQVLAEYKQRMAAEDALRKQISRQEWLTRLDEFLLDVGEAVGELLNILVKETQPKTILELGTSYGFSTIWLADAARSIGSSVITFDLNAGKQAYARKMLHRAELSSYVTFRCGNALELIDAMTETPGFVLIDLWKDLYISCFDRVLSKLAPGALIVADNMIFPPDNQANAAEYRAHIRRQPGIESVLVPIGHGIELTRVVV